MLVKINPPHIMKNVYRKNLGIVKPYIIKMMYAYMISPIADISHLEDNADKSA